MRVFSWALFLLLSFIVTLPISWTLLAKADFFYPVLHDSIGIDSHIKKYAPRNDKNKRDFENTNKQTRVLLFHGIVQAIQNNGEGLQQLSYQDKQHQAVLLLTDAEVVHLVDVAILLNKLKTASLVALLLWCGLLLFIFKKRIVIPDAKQLFLSAASILILCAAVLLLGPERIFNQLHIWAFPANHQWFFYYEDSLMSTMMKAPQLFAYIAVMLFIFSILITILLMKLIKATLSIIIYT